MTKKTIKTLNGHYHKKHKPVMAWWFCDYKNGLGYNLAGTTVTAGKTIVMPQAAPRLCRSGMHASKKIYDAFIHKKGFVLWRVRLEGDMDVSRRKISARSRTHIESVDFYPIIIKAIMESEYLAPQLPGRRYSGPMYYPSEARCSIFALSPTTKKFWNRVEELVWEEFKKKGYEE